MDDAWSNNKSLFGAPCCMLADKGIPAAKCICKFQTACVHCQ